VTAEGERRVALVPDMVRKLVAQDHELVVESGAGVGALVPDALFTAAGATIGDPWDPDVVVKVAPPMADETRRLALGTHLIAFLDPRGCQRPPPRSPSRGSSPLRWSRFRGSVARSRWMR
jgi:proton-translocating NAD(P)+ transhydrogenase subunit alpha